MTHEQSDKGSGLPAIIITGGQLTEMTPERRAQVAEALGMLWGAAARVVEPTVPPVEPEQAPVNDPIAIAQEPTQKDQVPTDPVVSPFSIFLAPDINSKKWLDDIALLAERIPGTFPRRPLLARALNVVRQRATHGAKKDSPNVPGFITYHMSEPSESGRRRVVAITFENPQRIISDEAYTIDTFAGLGEVSIRPLVQLMKNSGMVSSGAKPKI